jgi:hypothetical protein
VASTPEPTEPDAPLLKPGQLTPVEFLVKVANDPTIALELRLRAAQAALPFTGPRMAPHPIGKKEIERQRALEVVRGSKFGVPSTPPGLLPAKKRPASKAVPADPGWGDDLRPPESAIHRNFDDEGA